MGKTWLPLLSFLILFQIIPNEAAITVGDGVAIGFGDGDGGVWIGGGFGNTPTPPPLSKLSGVYTALQAWVVVYASVINFANNKFSNIEILNLTHSQKKKDEEGKMGVVDDEFIQGQN
ncbi:hypothetical protein V6N13_090532 [Hibiscus sabdariffa]